MLQAFFAVVYDLWCFVIGAEVKSGNNVVSHEVVSSSETPAPILHSESTEVSEMSQPSVVTEPPFSELAGLSPEFQYLHEPTIMYVSVQAAVVSLVPRLDFDGVIMTLPYGTAVTAVTYDGQYAKIFKADVEGWVSKDSLNPVKSAVWPTLIVGAQYDADNVETKKLRSCIDDAFVAGKLLLPLQAVEFITLRLAEDNRNISWPTVRPRGAGAWQWILRGRPRVHIGVHPTTDSIIEWLAEDGFGRLGYVEAVYPDQSIKVSLVGLHEAGVYDVVTWPAVVWRELRPVFIEIQ